MSNEPCKVSVISVTKDKGFLRLGRPFLKTFFSLLLLARDPQASFPYAAAILIKMFYNHHSNEQGDDVSFIWDFFFQRKALFESEEKAVVRPLLDFVNILCS